jgi:hypothetical protein
MHMIRRAKLLGLASLGRMGGMTLPSPHYLEHHNPQYFPEEPQFPLPRELAYQEEAAGLLQPKDKAAPVGAAPVPAVAPAGPAAAPGR